MRRALCVRRARFLFGQLELDLRPVARDRRLREHTPRLALQLLGIVGVARGDMCEHQPTRPSAPGELGRFTRRAVSRLPRARGFLVGERGFVDEQVGVLCRLTCAGAGAGVPRDDNARRAAPTSSAGSTTRPLSSVIGCPLWICPQSGPSGIPMARAKSGLKRPSRCSSTSAYPKQVVWR